MKGVALWPIRLKHISRLPGESFLGVWKWFQYREGEIVWKLPMGWTIRVGNWVLMFGIQTWGPYELDEEEECHEREPY